MLDDLSEAVEDLKLKELFRYSKMTVLAESGGKAKKYHYLVYIEFLELLCRLAYAQCEGKGVRLELQLLGLLESIFEKGYRDKALDPENDVLQPLPVPEVASSDDEAFD